MNMKKFLAYNSQSRPLWSFLLALLTSSTFALEKLESPLANLPSDIVIFDIATHIVRNGIPMEIQGLVSEKPVEDVANSFREIWGKPLLEDKLGDKLILSKMNGEILQTVELKSSKLGVEGFISITNLKQMTTEYKRYEEDRDRWLQKLPTQSELNILMRSKDVGKSSEYLMYSNRLSESDNLYYLKKTLATLGYQFEFENGMDKEQARKMPEYLATSKLAGFKGVGKDALVSLYSQPDGNTYVSLNMIYQELENK